MFIIKHAMVVFFALTMSLTSTGVRASNEVLISHLATPNLVGESRLKVLFWKVYDARLYSADGQYSAAKPFALSLTYLRDFKGQEIASRSIDEIRGQGFTDEAVLTSWGQQMQALFPDVKEGQNITGVRPTDGYAYFYKDGVLLGSIEDSEFANRFFGIWLDDNTSEPDMRKRLLGLK